MWKEKEFRVLSNQRWISYFFLLTCVCSKTRIMQQGRPKTCKRNSLYGEQGTGKGNPCGSEDWEKSRRFVSAIYFIFCHPNTRLSWGSRGDDSSNSWKTPKILPRGTEVLRPWEEFPVHFFLSLNPLTAWSWEQAQYYGKIMGNKVQCRETKALCFKPENVEEMEEWKECKKAIQ